VHTGYEFGPVQQWLDFDIIAAARRGDRDAVLRIAEQSRQWIDKCRSDGRTKTKGFAVMADNVIDLA
jgi:hypothetical protein